jgi:hypothetical protein
MLQLLQSLLLLLSPQVAALVGTKTCCEVIEFYYIWKLTGHYKQWKKLFYGPEHVKAKGKDSDSSAVTAASSSSGGGGSSSSAAAAAAAAAAQRSRPSLLQQQQQQHDSSDDDQDDAIAEEDSISSDESDPDDKTFNGRHS